MELQSIEVILSSAVLLFMPVSLTAQMEVAVSFPLLVHAAITRVPIGMALKALDLTRLSHRHSHFDRGRAARLRIHDGLSFMCR
jgi:hypothetical protein